MNKIENKWIKSLHFAKYNFAFTLAEMMVVMLLLSITLAASAPLMTKRAQSGNTANLWKPTAENAASIYYGTNDSQRVSIGNKIGTNAAMPAKLNIDSTSTPHISLIVGGTEYGKIYIDSANRLVLGDANTTVYIPGKIKVGKGATIDSGGAAIIGDSKVNGKFEATSDTKVGGTLQVSGKSTLSTLSAAETTITGNYPLTINATTSNNQITLKNAGKYTGVINFSTTGLMTLQTYNNGSLLDTLTNKTIHTTNNLYFQYGYMQSSRWSTGVAHGHAYYEVYPPSGYTMSDLVAFIPSMNQFDFAGTVDRNDRMECHYWTSSSHITINCYSTEMREAPYANYLAIWRRNR